MSDPPFPLYRMFCHENSLGPFKTSVSSQTKAFPLPAQDALLLAYPLPPHSSTPHTGALRREQGTGLYLSFPCQSLQTIKGNIGAGSSERLPGRVPWCWRPGASQCPPLFFRSCHMCFTHSFLMLWSLLPRTAP